MEYLIFYGTTFKSNTGKNKKCTWNQFKELFKTPKISNLSYEDMINLTKIKDNYKGKKTCDLTKEQIEEKKHVAGTLNREKDNNYIICGNFEGNTRTNGDDKLLGRNIIALDIDNANDKTLEKIKDKFKAFNYVLHTTFSHTKDKPRFRMYFPTDQIINNKHDYKTIVSNFVEYNGFEFETVKNLNGEVDQCSYKYNQLMFLPNKTKNGLYTKLINSGKNIEIDKYLTQETKETQQTINNINNESKPLKESKPDLNNVISPYDMDDSSIIKKYCLDYNIHSTIKNFIPDIYEKVGNRYMYVNSSSQVAGAIVYKDKHNNKSVYIFSNHGSDKLNDGHLHNSFDLLKIHKFNGNYDKTVDFINNLYNKNNYKDEEISGLELLNKFGDYQEELIKSPIYKTGFKRLDEYLDGGLRNALYVVAAGSSMGKTTFCQQITDNIIKQGNHVIYFSMEQSAFELMSKSVSRETYILNDLQDNGFSLKSKDVMYNKTPNIINRAIKSLNNMQNLLFKCSNYGFTIDQLEETIKRYISKHKAKPCIIVDYLQVLGHQDTRLTDKQRIDNNIQRLKEFTKTYKIPVIVLCSLNRQNYLVPISFEGFKESGGIEYTADVTLGLQYTKIENKVSNSEKEKTKTRELIKGLSNEPQREISLVCLKNRLGLQHFSICFEYTPKYNFFEELEDDNTDDLYNNAPTVQDNLIDNL